MNCDTTWIPSYQDTCYPANYYKSKYACLLSVLELTALASEQLDLSLTNISMLVSLASFSVSLKLALSSKFQNYHYMITVFQGCAGNPNKSTRAPEYIIDSSMQGSRANSTKTRQLGSTTHMPYLA